MKTKFFSLWDCLCVLCLLLFIAMIIMVKTVDVGAVGPCDTEIGFSHLNQAVHNAMGEHLFWYDFTDLLGYLALATVGGFGLMGLVQWIRRKSLFKVDPEVLILGGIYLVTLGSYGFFEKVIINLRPILLEGETFPEASFPSSHTVMTYVVMCTAAIMAFRYIRNRCLRWSVLALCVAVGGITVVGRFLSGVHWFTDILAGMLWGCTLVFAFLGLLRRFAKRQ